VGGRRSVGVCWRRARVSPVYRKATNGTAAKNSAPKTNFLGRFFSPCAPTTKTLMLHTLILPSGQGFGANYRHLAALISWLGVAHRTQVALLGFCGATNFIQPPLLSPACTASARVPRCLWCMYLANYTHHTHTPGLSIRTLQCESLLEAASRALYGVYLGMYSKS
jgi:hypothetical protein